MADLQSDAPVPDDVSSDVRSAIAELKGEAPAPDTSLAAPTDASGVDTPPSHEARPRNERGQFIKADGSVDPDQSPKPSTDADPIQANNEQPSIAAMVPKNWSADIVAELGKASPALQQAVVKRMAETDRAGVQWSDEKRSYETTLEPLRPIVDQYKVPPAEVINRLVSADRYLERDPAGGIRWLANAYGVDLYKLATEQPTPQAQPDPAVLSLSQKVSSLEQFIQTQQQSETLSTLDAFKAQPGHEHFDAVRVQMGKLMYAGLAKDLQDAYDQAVWASPDIRTSLMSATTAAARQREAAEKARRGAISLNGSPNGSAALVRTPAPAGTSAVDDVRAALEQLRH